MTIKILVATHKPYRMPADSVYLPLQVGAAGKGALGFRRDDDGENISAKNANWCELTGVYWAWKNLEADAVGLVMFLLNLSVGLTSGLCGGRYAYGNFRFFILRDSTGSARD